MDAEPDGRVVGRGAQVDGDRAGEGVSLFGGVATHLAGEGGCHGQRAGRDQPVDLRQQLDDEGAVKRYDAFLMAALTLPGEAGLAVGARPSAKLSRTGF